MTDKMLKFVKIGQQTPPKRKIGTRKEDFNEIYDEFVIKRLRENIFRVERMVYIANGILMEKSSQKQSLLWEISVV